MLIYEKNPFLQEGVLKKSYPTLAFRPGPRQGLKPGLQAGA